MTITRNAPISGILALALCIGAFPAGAQQSPPPDQQNMPSNDPSNSAQQAPPNYNNGPGENAPQYPPQYQMSQGPQGNQPYYQAPPPQPNVNVPASLNLPSGTVIKIRINEWLSSDKNVVGDGFSATLDQPIVADGFVVARRGQSLMGRVTEARKAGRVKGTSELGVTLSELTIVDGQQIPIQTQLLQTSAGTSNGRDAVAVGTTTGVGAAIGAAANGGSGAAVGAGAGLVAGVIGVLVTRGRQTVLPPETLLTFQLQSPMAISTEHSQFAFQPVTQADLDGSSAYGPRGRFAGERPAGPPPPYYPTAYGYPYPYYYGYYPAPFYFGFYGGRYGYGRFRR
jgi:hypothetical protein